MATKTKDKLLKLIDANIPIIYIQDYDFVRTDRLIDSVKVDENTKIFEWNPAYGSTQFSLKKDSPEKFFRKSASGLGGTVDELGRAQPLLADFLKEWVDFEGGKEERFLVLRNVHEELNDKRVVTYLQFLAQRRLEEEPFNTTVFIVSSVLNIPEELSEFVSVFEIDFPDEEEIESIIREHATVNDYIIKDRKVIDELMSSLKGLTRFQVDRMIDMVMCENGTLETEDREMILQQKRAIVKKSGILELVETPASLEDVGGLENLKDYLKNKEKIFKKLEEAKRFGVRVPKGIFLVGMPGCGKSLCAKAAAALFNAPLLQLDMGRLQAKYVGESEANLRKAIRTAEAVAPCVLWIDEIEKGFANRGGENDVVMRMFATFLSWMQEKKSSVYVIATANKADDLPPELMRKGRVDEIFCVKLPNAEERKAIFEVHLKRFAETTAKLEVSEKDYAGLVKASDGFNGADIEAAVNDAAEAAFLEEGDKQGRITKQVLLDAIGKTKSISVSCKKKIEGMEKAFKDAGFTSASKEEKKTTRRAKV
ncbi:MAG: AAA family ATPase [Candidatus Spyradosoma sp.]